ncbi:MAG: ATP-dependent 6-phosphofructokinase [Promethearchaeota archaeon]|nr:MAG: ATP-dependent 6-phosphofructokinase [Candidatus Lokiarchaeota archaeon]
MTIKRVGIMTGGGDCPGLNSVIYGIMLKAFDVGIECVGIIKGWKGVLENITIPLNIAEHDDLHTIGGTLLYTSRTNPFAPVKEAESEEEKENLKKKISQEIADSFEDLGIDALVVIGGDDTQGVADTICKYTDAKIIGCPKTIDNDLAGTDYTFGFWSAVQLASNSMDNLTTTARSHQRIFIVEVMGRDAGFLTIYSGISSGADIILIPETPFDFEKHVVEVLKRRVNAGHKYHIIATSEGAYPTDESLKRDFQTISQDTIDNLPKDPFGNPLLSKLKISKILVDELRMREDLKEEFKKNDTNYECRSVVLGHTMRAGTPNSFDRILGLRFGLAVMKQIIKGDFGKMVSLKGNKIKAVPLSDGVQKDYVSAEGDIVELRNLMVKIRYKARELDLEKE